MCERVRRLGTARWSSLARFSSSILRAFVFLGQRSTAEEFLKAAWIFVAEVRCVVCGSVVVRQTLSRQLQLHKSLATHLFSTVFSALETRRQEHQHYTFQLAPSRASINSVPWLKSHYSRRLPGVAVDRLQPCPVAYQSTSTALQIPAQVAVSYPKTSFTARSCSSASSEG